MIPFDQIFVQIVNGLVNGMILALVASGLTLIFGIMDIVNFAHGDLFMLGAYVGTTAFLTTGSFWVALVSAVVVMAVLGAALQVIALRPLLGRDPLTTILATFGLSLVIQNYALWQYGPVPRKILEPVSGHFRLFYVEYPWYRIVIALMSAAIIGALYLFMKYGKHGIWIRATTQDRVMAAAMGPHGGVRDRRRHGRRQRRALRPHGGHQPRDGVRLHPARLRRGGRGRHGESGRLHSRLHLHQPAGIAGHHLGQPRPGRDRVVRRADPHPPHPAHRSVRADAEMTR